MELQEIAKRQFAWVKSMGWHNGTVLEKLALIASEVGEAADELPAGHPAHFKISGLIKAIARAVNACRKARPSKNFGEELADILLRVVDLAEEQGVDIQAEVLAKMAKNQRRGTRGRMI